MIFSKYYEKVYSFPSEWYNKTMKELPSDPAILFSFLNTKLRDEYDSLEAFCADTGWEIGDLLRRFHDLGLRYDERTNRVEFL